MMRFMDMRSNPSPLGRGLEGVSDARDAPIAHTSHTPTRAIPLQGERFP